MTQVENLVNWQSTILPLESKVSDVIVSLNKSMLKIVLVVDASGRLCGVITDGDIRRGLLAGNSLEASTTEIMNHAPVVGSTDDNNLTVQNLMVLSNIDHLPIIDKAGMPVGIFAIAAPSNRRRFENTVVIMAGGKGLRLRPLTADCPKPMLEVAGKPILRHVIEQLRDQGFLNICLAINYLGDVIEEYFGDGGWLGVRINYVRESKALGTAGALSLVNPVSSAPVIVLNGDVVSEVSFSSILQYHSRCGGVATVAVRKYVLENPFGVVDLLDNEITGFTEKPRFESNINAGIYVLEPRVLELLKQDTYADMPDFIAKLTQNGCKAYAYPLHEDWIDVGRKDDLLKLRDRASSGNSVFRSDRRGV